MDRTQLHSLQQLARLYGVQTAYYDFKHQRQQASPEALLPVLRALGAPVGHLGDVPAALRMRRQALCKRFVEPVAVAWEGGPLALELRMSTKLASQRIRCHLRLENGEPRVWTCDPELLPALEATEVEGARYVRKKLAVPGTLPPGYHRLTLEIQGRAFETMIISAPLKAYAAPGRPTSRVWGVFLPLYALHSRRSWGCGDFSDLEALMGWVTKLGGGLVATLPFLASFLEEPFDPSPYVPASRLFWNEFFVDVTRVPERERCPAAQTLLSSSGVQAELEALRSSPLVDYRRQMELKRQMLEELARCFFAERSERHASFRRFLEAHPTVEDYARFRAAGERQHSPWPQWPQRLRDGLLKPGDYDEEAKRYHMYAQWLAHEQIQSLSTRARSAGLGLYLDLPLGVHPYGYDVWRERAVFASDVTGGAPPDAFFTKGQNWGFPPFHPEEIRAEGYRYAIACLRHLLQHAGILRIDHVMGLHRLFWVPRGLEARQGVYVRYPAEELYALLALESHRHQALILGENLGTVPRYIRPTMARHNIHRMYVMQYELSAEPDRPLRAIGRDAVASLNTHDMPPFAAFWQGLDIQDRLEMDLLDEVGAQRERKKRQTLKRALARYLKRKGRPEGTATGRAVLEALLAHLSASPARVVLVNLEDLWLERQPQNVPGTQAERANWQRKARYSLEAICEMPRVCGTLRQIDRLRRRGMNGR